MATLTPTPRSQIVNLPNILTSARLVLAVVLFVLIGFHEQIGHVWLWCLLVFVVAAITDGLDGYIARRQGLTSSLGRNLDPVVDKVLMCGAFIFMQPIEGAHLQPWMVVIVVSRELIITSLRGYLEAQGVMFGADMLGKLKMVLQCAALIAIFVQFQVKSWPGWPLGFFEGVSLGLVYGMVFATALSGLQYLWKATVLLKRD